MSNQLITEENYDEKIHGCLKNGCDAFGNAIKPPDGYRLLRNDILINDKIQKGDIHFDIYAGWTEGHNERHDGDSIINGGRWRAWARKV